MSKPNTCETIFLMIQIHMVIHTLNSTNLKNNFIKYYQEEWTFFRDDLEITFFYDFYVLLFVDIKT